MGGLKLFCDSPQCGSNFFHVITSETVSCNACGLLHGVAGATVTITQHSVQAGKLEDDPALSEPVHEWEKTGRDDEGYPFIRLG